MVLRAEAWPRLGWREFMLLRSSAFPSPGQVAGALVGCVRPVAQLPLQGQSQSWLGRKLSMGVAGWAFGG